MENWDDYRFFLTVARKGNVSAAASELGLNHSTVSRRISALETRLGMRLFDRLRTGFVPTAAAMTLIEAAEQLERGAHRIGRLANAKDARLAGKLTVTAPVAFLRYVLMPIAAQFHASYPDVELHLAGSDRISNLASREADIALRIADSPTDTLVGMRLAPNRAALFAAPDLLDRLDTDAASAGRLNDMPWISVEGCEDLSRVFREGKATCHVNDKMSAIGAAVAGLGVVELPEMIGNAEPRLVRLGGIPAWTDKDIFILYHRDLRHTARVRAFVATVRQHLARPTAEMAAG